MLEQKFNQRLKLCDFFEQLVLEITQNMEISGRLSSDKQEHFVRALKPVKKQVNKK
ncbi:MAG: hypothetical protein ACI4OG_00005 [Bacilli bacterium]